VLPVALSVTVLAFLIFLSSINIHHILFNKIVGLQVYSFQFTVYSLKKQPRVLVQSPTKLWRWDFFEIKKKF
jgi:hypothetical protein